MRIAEEIDKKIRAITQSESWRNHRAII